MRPVRNRWPTSDIARNVKFAAQTFREALSLETFESFRVATLDAPTMLREIIHLAMEIARSKVPLKTLYPCLNELQITVERDPTASKVVREEMALFASRFPVSNVSEKSLKDLRALALMMARKLAREYREALAVEMCEEMKAPRNHEKIRKNVNAFCSHLINSGYSRQHILEKVDESFLSRPIKKVESRTTARFLSKFDGKQRTFIIYLPVNRAFYDYASKLGFEEMETFEFRQLPIDARKALLSSSPSLASSGYIRVMMEAKDEYAALKAAQDFVYSLVAITYMNKRGIEFTGLEMGFVKVKKGRLGRLLKLEPFLFQRVSKTVTSGTLRQLEGQTEQIFTQFSDQSTHRLISSINMAALARSTSRPENQLVSLWSAVEVLLGDPPEKTSRIEFYTRSLTPCIILKYVRRYIMAIVDELRLSYPRQVRTFFRNPQFDQSLDQYTKLSLLVFEPSFEPLRRPFCSTFVDNPAVLSRLWKLEQNFSTPKAFLASLEQYETRVRWLLYRIYRTRNAIVHNGIVPSYMTPLVMNAFEYYRGSIGPILGRASLNPNPSAIDQIIAELGFEVDMLKRELRQLRGNPTFTDEQIRRFHR